jgi:hypothetical protein
LYITKVQKKNIFGIEYKYLIYPFGLSEPEVDLLLVEPDDREPDEVGLGRIDWSHLDELLIFDDFELFPTTIWSNLNNLIKFTLELSFQLVFLSFEGEERQEIEKFLFENQNYIIRPNLLIETYHLFYCFNLIFPESLIVDLKLKEKLRNARGKILEANFCKCIFFTNNNRTEIKKKYFNLDHKQKTIYLSFI